jgi:hypothetical protein
LFSRIVRSISILGTNVAWTSFEFPQGYSIYMEGAQGDAVAYWRFPAHPPGTQPGIVKKSLRLSDVICAYNGPDLIRRFRLMQHGDRH